MTEAIIKIKDRHICQEDDVSFELTTFGEFEVTENGCKIVYTETDKEMEDCVTTLVFEEKAKVSMFRSGRYSTEMMIEKDRRHLCYYSTPFGELLMGIYAKKVSCNICESGGTLDFCYTIDFNNTQTSENELSVTVIPK